MKLTLDLQGLTRQAHTSLYIVLAAVGRTADDVAIFARHAADVVSACSINLLKIVALLQWAHRMGSSRAHPFPVRSDASAVRRCCKQSGSNH